MIITSEECVTESQEDSIRTDQPRAGGILFIHEDAAILCVQNVASLAKVRKGQFEGMPEKLFLEPDWRLTTVKERSPNCWCYYKFWYRNAALSPTISTWIQTIWKLPPLLPKSSVDQAVATSS